MKFTIIYEKVDDPSFAENYYYAHIPSLNLTTHGKGIEGAKDAAKDLIKLWIEEKIKNGEVIKEESDTYYSKIEI